MKIHRFIGQFNLGAAKLDLPREEAHQIRSVLKLKPAEQITLCDGQGNDALASIIEIGKDSVTVGILETTTNKAEPERRVRLYCAILKHDNFETAVQKASEVGVTEIIPLKTARTVKTDAKIDRLQKIAKEAAELAGRGIIPSIRPAMPFGDALETANDIPTHYLFDGSGEQFQPSLDAGASVAAWVGPEGGWTEEELALASAKDFVISSLGPRVLRGETAAIIATYLLAC
jgi:16S rRNA (uracil1498-N3)-methyltransferase